MSEGRGGARPGAGRPKGAMSRAAADAIARAKATGELPHEFLLRVSRGEKLAGEKDKPDLKTRIAAAQAAAPYFAPKLSFAENDNNNDPNNPKNLTNEELAARIADDERVLEQMRKAKARPVKAAPKAKAKR